MMKHSSSAGILPPILAVASATHCAAALSLEDAIGGPADFPIFRNGRAGEILMDKSDAEVVRIAAGFLASDVERVSGVKPAVGMR